MGNNITQKLKYKESVVKFSYKYGVTKTAIKFNECRRTINRLSWQTFLKNKKTLFEETLEKLGIEYRTIKPHTPKENGRVERSHRKRPRKILL